MRAVKKAILVYLEANPGAKGNDLFEAVGTGFSRRAFTDALVALRQSGRIENRGGQGTAGTWFLPEHPEDDLPTLIILFVDNETGDVNYAVNGVRLIRHITLSEVGFTNSVGHIRSCSFLQTERLEIKRV